MPWKPTIPRPGDFPAVFKAFAIVAIIGVTAGCVRHVARPSNHIEMSIGDGPFSLTRRLVPLASVRVGSYPKSVAIDPIAGRAYVCNLEGGSVDIIRTSDHKRLKRISFRRTPLPAAPPYPDESYEEKPVETAFTGNGRYVWISLLRAGGVAVYDIKERRVPPETKIKWATIVNRLTGNKYNARLRFIPTGEEPKVIAVTPDQRRVFVSNWRGNSVTVIDAKTFEPVETIRVGFRPRGICFTETSAYVANFGSHSISEIDLKTLAKRRTFRQVGRNPRHLIIAPDRQTLYVSNHGDNRVREIDLLTGRVVRAWWTGKEPRSTCLSDDKHFLFVTNYKDDTVSALDLRSTSDIAVAPTLQRPIGTAYDPVRKTVWVSSYWNKTVEIFRWEAIVESKTAGLQETFFSAVTSPSQEIYIPAIPFPSKSLYTSTEK